MNDLIIEQVNRPPLDPEVFDLLCHGYEELTQGNIAKCIEWYDKAVGLAENKGLLYEKYRAMRDLAAALNDGGFYQESVQICDSVLKDIRYLDQYNNAGILLNKGTALMSLNQPEEALKCYLQGYDLIKLIPDNMLTREVTEIRDVLRESATRMQEVMKLIEEHGASQVSLIPDRPNFVLSHDAKEQVLQTVKHLQMFEWDPSSDYVLISSNSEYWTGDAWAPFANQAYRFTDRPSLYDFLVQEINAPILRSTLKVIKNLGKADQSDIEIREFTEHGNVP